MRRLAGCGVGAFDVGVAAPEILRRGADGGGANRSGSAAQAMTLDGAGEPGVDAVTTR
ncbi:hypothetical protein [Burkholderia mayonis]|uniref:hypothetical protein n=1 Tax=Burkholderia mayonis TaxID=1385591 RepID=UPI000AAE46EF|nr:hypothetical protein [Burkholderia mayonis]